MDKTLLQKTPLGKITAYVSQYNPNLLCTVPRALAREDLHIVKSRPFSGVDVWTSYEFSWLNAQGKPQTTMIEFWVADNSTNILESKSFKLYLNAFSQTTVSSIQELQATLQKDLTTAVSGEISIKLILPEVFSQTQRTNFLGICLDSIDIATHTYDLDPDFLVLQSDEKVSETLYSNLFSNICPVTKQPDWASVQIRYSGRKINHEALLKYLISFRKHDDFHEHCTEQIFMDIWNRCTPEKLTVYMQFARRGGLDINPFRSNFEKLSENLRSFRQ